METVLRRLAVAGAMQTLLVVAVAGCGGRATAAGTAPPASAASGEGSGVPTLEGGVEQGVPSGATAEENGRTDAESDGGSAQEPQFDSAPSFDAPPIDVDALAAEGFPQWVSSYCQTDGGVCTDPNCSPTSLSVTYTPCGAWDDLPAVGCVPDTTATDGLSCFVRQSDGLIIVGLPPQLVHGTPGLAGLARCDQLGLPTALGDAPNFKCNDF